MIFLIGVYVNSVNILLQDINVLCVGGYLMVKHWDCFKNKDPIGYLIWKDNKLSDLK